MPAAQVPATKMLQSGVRDARRSGEEDPWGTLLEDEQIAMSKDWHGDLGAITRLCHEASNIWVLL